MDKLNEQISNVTARRVAGSVVVAFGVVLPGISACSSTDEDPQKGASAESRSLKQEMLGPTSASPKGVDYYDASGRLWRCKGKAAFQSAQPQPILQDTKDPWEGQPKKRIADMTLQELAEAIRPVRLVGEYEYQLAEPDLLVAAKIKAMVTPPNTQGFRPGTVQPPELSIEDGVTPKVIVYDPYDDRIHTYDTTIWPASLFGRVQQNCTMTMIGPSTALSAAHCYYWNNAWVTGSQVSLGANNHTNSWSTVVTPYGSTYADTYTIPGQWMAGGGASPSGDWQSHDAWAWDFAILEFSPTQSPGYTVGWHGTSGTTTGSQYLFGYPAYDPNYSWQYPASQWLSSGVYQGYWGTSTNSTLWHVMDMWGGESGGCFYNTSYNCTGIQSSFWTNPNTGYAWNEARVWDSVTYNFFDTYANWP